MMDFTIWSKSQYHMKWIIATMETFLYNGAITADLQVLHAF